LWIFGNLYKEGVAAAVGLILDILLGSKPRNFSAWLEIDEI